MRSRILAFMGVFTVALVGVAPAALAQQTGADIPRTSDGRPDLSGTYDTDSTRLGPGLGREKKVQDFAQGRSADIGKTGAEDIELRSNPLGRRLPREPGRPRRVERTASMRDVQ